MGWIGVAVASALLAVPAIGRAQELDFGVHSRVGYDSNVFSDDDETQAAVIAMRLTGELSEAEVVCLDEAIENLVSIDERKARVVELRFFYFLVAVLAIHWALRNDRARKVFLLAASYAFYAAWDYRFLSLILISTLVDYAAGIGMARAGPRRRPAHNTPRPKAPSPAAQRGRPRRSDAPCEAQPSRGLRAARRAN